MTVRVSQTAIEGLLVLEPEVLRDNRGFFFESYNQRAFAELGIHYRFVQDNQSRSHKNVLRGLHYQIQRPQGKLVSVVSGEVFDVSVDLRRDSPTFGKWMGEVISAENRKILWAPPGFAHGFLVLSESAEVLYKATDLYAPEHERTIRWDDPELGIVWPLSGPPVLSPKDRLGQAFRDAETYAGMYAVPQGTGGRN